MRADVKSDASMISVSQRELHEERSNLNIFEKCWPLLKNDWRDLKIFKKE